jgi:hypothetical protein
MGLRVAEHGRHAAMSAGLPSNAAAIRFEMPVDGGDQSASMIVQAALARRRRSVTTFLPPSATGSALASAQNFAHSSASKRRF